jgi:hypothetical protein
MEPGKLRFRLIGRGSDRERKMAYSKLAGIAVAAMAVMAAPGLSWGQAHDMHNMAHDQPANGGGDREGSVFACENGTNMGILFATKNTNLVAIVDMGEGQHTLALKPWKGGEAQITWSDGQRTLTWSPGVQLMWMDGSNHLMCGRAEHHH